AQSAQTQSNRIHAQPLVALNGPPRRRLPPCRRDVSRRGCDVGSHDHDQRSARGANSGLRVANRALAILVLTGTASILPSENQLFWDRSLSSALAVSLPGSP